MRHVILMLLALVIFKTGVNAGNPFGENADYAYILETKPIELSTQNMAPYGEVTIPYGDLSELRGQQSIYCFYYTDDALYKKQPIIDTRDVFFDENRLQSEKEICDRFIDCANDKGPDDFYFSGKRISRYILKLHVTKVDEHGTTTLYAMVFDTDKKALVFEQMYYGKGGRIGSLTNLMGDAAEWLGKCVGHDFKRALR